MSGNCKVLLVGYEGFSRYWPNPAGELVMDLDGENILGCTVESQTLPVSLDEVKVGLPKMLKDATIALGVGLDPKATIPRLETAAVNIAHFVIPDVSGNRVEVEEILPGEPLTLPTGLPYGKIYKRCKDRNLPLRIGLGTGTYLCNTMAYILHYWSSKTSKPAGFIHIPPDTQTTMRIGEEGGIPRWLLREVLHCIIETILEELHS
ncbi:MAG: hypothetical protein F7B78_03020 [Desulfurococcales archaeon]|nr:hypothetical protein [Desulfurococcales archaeon]